MRFYDAGSCKHIAAVLIQRYDEMMKKSLTNEQISEQILSLFYNKNDQTRKIKKELKLEIDLSFDTRYYETYLIPKIKIGYDKMYNFNSKCRKFYEVYDEITNELTFGKGFTYTKGEYFFTKEDEKLIEFLKMIKVQNESIYYRRDYLAMEGKDISKFLDLIKDKTFTINGKKYHGIKKESPYESSLKKEKDTYKTFQIEVKESTRKENKEKVKQELCSLLRKVLEEEE